MAHFAELDENNIVIQVIVVDDNDCEDDDGVESEAVGVAFCQSLFGENTVWKQTSYNNNIRTRYAGIGYTYDEDLNAFIPPKPFDSWVLNAETKDWEAPVPLPQDADTVAYWWDEVSGSWQTEEDA